MIKNVSFDEYMNREKSTRDVTDNGKCTQCGGCCSNLLPMTNSEVALVKKYIKKHHIKERKESGIPLAKPTMDMTCPFLDTSKPKEKCMIYNVRPGICKHYVCNRSPFDALDDEELFKEPHYVVNMRKTFFGGGSR